MDWHPIQRGRGRVEILLVTSCYRNWNECWPDGLLGLPPSELPFAERVLVQNVSRENHLIFMQMTVQVTCIFIPIVSHKDSFCHRGKSKLGIGLFIHELLRKSLILSYFSHVVGLENWKKLYGTKLRGLFDNIH